MAGKGWKRRPTNEKKFDENYSEISWKAETEDKFKIVRKHGKVIKQFVYK